MCDAKTAWQRCIDFHGHACPGLAIGYRAAEAAIRLFGFTRSADEEIVCVTENDACGVDAIQVMTGCSIGKGNLIYRDRGKQAFSFFNRNTGRAVRIVFKKQLSREGMDREALQAYLLQAPLEEIFDYKEPSFLPPERARLYASVVCERCGESAPEHKMRLEDGKKLCLDCCHDYSRGW